MPQAKTLCDTELRAVLAVTAQSTHPSRNRMMLLLSHWAGLRVGEIASLRIADVVCSSGKVKDQVYLRPSQTKGSKGRTVFLPDKLQKELAHYLRGMKAKSPESALIPSQRSRIKGFSSDSLGQQFIALYKRAGISGATSHSGRRTFITNLANKGVSARVLMSLAGHKNLSTTQLYIDVNDELKRSAVNLI